MIRFFRLDVAHWLRFCFTAGLLCFGSIGGAQEESARVEPSTEAVVDAKLLDDALVRASGNRGEIERALQTVPAEELRGMQFLIAYMPERDLQSLKADYLLENVRLAYRARREFAFARSIPEEIFLNDVLPYANINERRDAWRQEFNDRFRDVVKDVATPSLAAARLNQIIFQQLNVKYSTKRRRADQGPRESMESGLASCTGLSILLIDACRAVGIPARFAGTPLWSDNSGNHSWVEIWDNGWHFTGAAEASGDQLDQAWFIDRASKATVGNPKHGIFAVSYRKTPIRFPMVWAPEIDDVYAVDITERYVELGKKVPEGFVRTRFRTLGLFGPERCQANIVIKDEAGDVVFRGQSKDERFDANDHTTIALPQGKAFTVEIQNGNQRIEQKIVAERDEQLVTLRVSADDSDPLSSLTMYLAKTEVERPKMADQPFANIPLTKEQALKARELLWEDRMARLKVERAEEMKAKVIKDGMLEMPFEYTVFGEAPAGGRALVISMHGGGGAPKRVNDQQWKNQQKLYEIPEGVYVAPRAPTDTWNLWHQDHIDRMFVRLIEDFVVMEGVDPNRVFLTGYSAGGDGVYQVAPRMADRFAAAGMMAGHPNESRPFGLRNLPFTLHVGGNDAAYNRNQVAADWGKQLEELRVADAEGYKHWVKIHEGKGHWMDRQETEGIQWMLAHVRAPNPRKLVWYQDDVLHDRFYWLERDIDQCKAGDKVVASVVDQTVSLEEAPPGTLRLLLSDEWIDLDREIQVRYGDKTLWSGKVQRSVRVIGQSFDDRVDRAASFSAIISLEVMQ